MRIGKAQDKPETPITLAPDTAELLARARADLRMGLPPLYAFRFVLAEHDVLDASKRPVPPLVGNPRFVLVERWADPSDTRPVVLYELVPTSP